MSLRFLRHGVLIVSASLLAACNPITIGGSVTGLAGAGLVLQNNGGDDLAITADGDFTFATALPNSGGPYEVTIKSQPSGQVCTVTNGSGTATAKVTDVAIQCTANAVAELHLLAGTLGGPGNIDGMDKSARFNGPFGIAVDSTGNAYVADSANHTIRKISPTGMVTTLAGMAGIPGSTDGAAADARFNRPSKVAIDSQGNLYISDTNNYTIRKISPAGEVATLAGLARYPGSANGTGTGARFMSPSGIALDGAGNVYVTDHSSHCIRKISPAGVVTTLAGTAGTSGSADGAGSTARFNYPLDITVDSTGNAYVTDVGNRIIRKIDPAGTVTTLAGSSGTWGGTDGTGTAATFSNPQGIAVDSAGNIYVADTENNTIRRINPAGAVTTLAGKTGETGSTDGTAGARFNKPAGITLDSAGNVYVADLGNNVIRKINTTGTTSTLAGMAGVSGSSDGTGIDATFHLPSGIMVDNAGNTYTADYFNHTIRKISPAGNVTTVAGTAGIAGRTDGTGADARFYYPTDITVDSDGNTYVADHGACTIRKISASGVVSTLAGDWLNHGSADGIGADARFDYPRGIALDGANNVYVTDSMNSTIRKISPAGVVTTLAGSAGSPGSVDGVGASARFDQPVGIAVDNEGNIYVSDSLNNTIRMISPSGIVTTLAGSAGNSGNIDGVGADARFNRPLGLALDDSNNVYVADSLNNTIRKISPSGVVTTVLGSPGSIGIQLGSLPGSLGIEPIGVAVAGDRLVVTSGNTVLWANKR